MQNCFNHGNALGGVGLGSLSEVGTHTVSTPPTTPATHYYAIEVGERCPLNCKHCIYNTDQAVDREPEESLLQSVIETARETMPYLVSFVGKEPTAFPNTLAHWTKEVAQHTPRVVVMTNGLFSTDTLLQSLDAVTCFDISVDGDEAAHAWMRGNKKMFARTWETIQAIQQQHHAHVGVIATAVNARIVDGTPQWTSIPRLAKDLAKEFDPSRVSLTVSLYYGAPGDPMLLTKKQLSALISQLAAINFPVRVLYTAQYHHLLGLVMEDLGVSLSDVRYDTETGIPVLCLGSVKLLTCNLTKRQQIPLRFSSDGNLYLGCNHLALPQQKRQVFGLGSSSGAKALLSGETHLPNWCSSLVPDQCRKCNFWNSCQGGDRQSGVYWTGHAQDPYCPLI